MTIASRQSDVARYQRGLADLQKKLADESKKEVAKAKDLERINRSITSSISASALRSKRQQITRIMDEAARIQAKKADLSKKIADQSSRLHRAEEALRKEQERDRKRTHEAQRKREREQLVYERSVTSEMKLQSSLSDDSSSRESTKNTEYDVFICHASEDKEGFVEPLAKALVSAGYRVWYDEFTVKVGDSLRRSIDEGLANSRYGVVVFSQAFFAKNWTR